MNKSLTNYYVLNDPDKPNGCKVGITKNPEQRIKSYRTAAPNCSFIKVFKNVEKYHEKRILDLLKDIYTVQSEYVHASPKMVLNTIEGYFDDFYEQKH